MKVFFQGCSHHSTEKGNGKVIYILDEQNSDKVKKSVMDKVRRVIQVGPT